MKAKRNLIPAIGVMFVLAAACTQASALTSKPVGETKLLTDFEDASIWMSENQSPFAVAAQRVTQGKGSLRVNLTNKPQWSNILTTKPPLTDWTGWKFINFDIYLEGDEPATIEMWIRDTMLHKAITQDIAIGPGWNTVTIDLDDLHRRAELDRSKVTSFCIYKLHKQELTFHLDNMYLSKARPIAPKLPSVRTGDANLVTNGGFEVMEGLDKFGSPFLWWKSRRWSGASFLGRGWKAVYKGSSSAMLDGRGRCKIGFYTPAMKVKSPTKLKVTVYIQGKDLIQGRRRAGAISLTSSSEKVLSGGTVRIPGGTYAWKKVEMIVDVPATDHAVKVFVQLFDKGRLWVDEVSVTGVDLDARPGVKITDTGHAFAVDPPIVSETPAQAALKKTALDAMDGLRKLVARAKRRKIETLYHEIPLMMGDLAFNVRWDLPKHLELRDGYCKYVTAECIKAQIHLRAVMAGWVPDLKVPPHPKLSRLKLKGRYWTLNGKPKILFSMQYHKSGKLTRWFIPQFYQQGISAVGASRYNFQSTPVWAAYQKYPETHRVYDGGWCGHIIKDQFSAGGTGQCVINLDSPKMLQAISDSIRTVYVPKVKRAKVKPLYVNMGFEYSYVNYDKYSLIKFRKWLERKHGNIAGLNKVWKTSHKNFETVTLPSYHWAVEEKNPAKYYDWGSFNLWRFTDFMKWAKVEMRKNIPGLLTTTGGGMPFGAGFWKQGIDEEALADEGVCDIWLSETSSRSLAVTDVMDLQRSLSPNKAIVDPEYHAKPNTVFLIFLHGCGLMDYWWWPPNPGGQFEATSLKHSHLLTLPEVATTMRTALDVRRIPEYIVPFPEAKPEIVMLYPRATLIQKLPGAKGHKTPFSIETEKSYSAAVRLDTPVGFASSKRIREGMLDEVKVLVIPGCRFVGAEVVDKIMAWAKSGGTVVITPTSLIGDEYTRKRSYLKDIGIEIAAEELPEFMAGEAKRGIDQSGELDFIQGPVAKTIIKAEPKRTVTTKPIDVFAKGTPTLKAAGVIQTINPSADWKVLGTYTTDGKPALLVRPLGKGKVYYMACQLDLKSRKALFDRLMDDHAFTRPIRALTPTDGYLDGVESRTVPFDGNYLTYLHNETGKSVVVKLDAKGKQFASIFNVNTQTKVLLPVMTLAPYETRIMKITLK